jgi:hypothetical protein
VALRLLVHREQVDAVLEVRALQAQAADRVVDRVVVAVEHVAAAPHSM